MLLIFSWSVICSKMAYHVSLGSMTGTWKRESQNFLPIFLMYCFISLYSLPLTFVLSLQISFLGYLKLSELLLPCIVSPQPMLFYS